MENGEERTEMKGHDLVGCLTVLLNAFYFCVLCQDTQEMESVLC